MLPPLRTCQQVSTRQTEYYATQRRLLAVTNVHPRPGRPSALCWTGANKDRRRTNSSPDPVHPAQLTARAMRLSP